MDDLLRYSWTQPICEDCCDERHPDRRATRVRVVSREECVYCSKTTGSGIYVRIDPHIAPYPTRLNITITAVPIQKDK